MVWMTGQLSHPNTVPFIGAYPTPTHPFALVHEMVENIDLCRYLEDRPEASRLKLVSTVFTISIIELLADTSLFQLVGISRALEWMHKLYIIHGNLKMVTHLISCATIVCSLLSRGV